MNFGKQGAVLGGVWSLFAYLIHNVFTNVLNLYLITCTVPKNMKKDPSITFQTRERIQRSGFSFGPVPSTYHRDHIYLKISVRHCLNFPTYFPSLNNPFWARQAQRSKGSGSFSISWPSSRQGSCTWRSRVFKVGDDNLAWVHTYW